MFRYTQIITFILSALMYFSVGRENLIGVCVLFSY